MLDETQSKGYRKIIILKDIIKSLKKREKNASLVSIERKKLKRAQSNKGAI